MDGPVAAKPTQVLDKDDYRQGHNAASAPEDFIAFVVYGAAFAFFTLQQMAATENTIFGLLQANVSVGPNSTAQQISEAYNGAMDHNHLIAFAIAASVQLFLLSIAFPGTRSLLLAHSKSRMPSSASSNMEALRMAQWQKVVTVFLLFMEVLTDFLYAIEGHDLFAGTVLWIFPGLNNPGTALGVLLVGIIYPVAVCGATVFFGNISSKRLGACIHHIKAYAK